MKRVLLLLVLAGAPPEPPRGAPDFPNDVLPQLTRLGCNSGTCHGSATGQKGFKLSLLGFDPSADYAAITRELRGRRVDLASPERSLILRKPTRELKHGGGKVLEKDSEAYRMVTDWLRAGAPFRSGPPVDLLRIEAEPGRVIAHYTDGSTRDVTRLALRTSNDDSIADADGNVLKPGETSIMVRYGGRVAAVTAGRPYGPRVEVSDHRNFVDDSVNEKLSRYGLPPLGPCDDATFVRRATLDALGTIPTPEDAASFTGDRNRLIDELLERPEFADYWSGLWTRSWPVRGPEFQEWFRGRWNDPYGDTVRLLLTREPHLYRSVGDPKQLAEFVGQSLLGSRWMCAQCHDHPFERFTRRDYMGMAAFFARVRVRDGRVELESRGELELDGKPVPPPFGSREDRREDLAGWVTAGDAFARATANRVWGLLMGRGLVEPVDDLRASNPPSHPGLLDALGAEFRKDGSLKRLIGLVMKSAAYGRRTGRGDAFYAARAVKPLAGAVLARAVSRAAGRPLAPDPVLAGATLARTLHLMNSPEIDGLLAADSVEHLYWRTLSRAPTAAERAMWTGTDDTYLKDLFWALLNSKEFGTNH